jgi:hypothetical protein
MLAPRGVRQPAIRTLIGACVRFFPIPNSEPPAFSLFAGGFLLREGQRRRHTGPACDISGKLPHYLRRLDGQSLIVAARDRNPTADRSPRGAQPLNQARRTGSLTRTNTRVLRLPIGLLQTWWERVLAILGFTFVAAVVADIAVRGL